MSEDGPAGACARRSNVSVECKGSNRRGMPNAFCLHLVQSYNTFAHGGRDHGYEAARVKAESVDIEPKIHLLLSGDWLAPNKLTMPATLFCSLLIHVVNFREDIKLTGSFKQYACTSIGEDKIAGIHAIAVI